MTKTRGVMIECSCPKNWPGERCRVHGSIRDQHKMSVEAKCLEIAQEYNKARTKFNPMRGPHEGYAVILEELDEMWDAIKANDIPHARKECLQVAAMCLAFLLEVKE